jgi:hypothetical protein
MGRLDQPLNTFWQLFFRPEGATSWSDQVGATAAATNGGLVLASLGGAQLVVGVRPSDLLTFSPLITTSDAGRSWSDGLVPSGLAASPDALALGPNGRALALVRGRAGPELMATSGDLSRWVALASANELASSPAGRACGLQAVTALGYLAGSALAGASCRERGVAGVLVLGPAGRWRLAGPPLPPSLARDQAEVLTLAPGKGGLAALVASRGTGAQPGSRFLAAWEGSATAGWRTSAPLQPSRALQVASVGATGNGGLFVLLSGQAGAEELYIVAGPGSPWRQLAAPPTGTATVAFGPGATVEALAVDGTVLTVWSLAPRSRAWSKEQVVRVPVQFGSSS